MEQKKRPSLRATQPRKNLEIRTAALFSTNSYSRGFGGMKRIEAGSAAMRSRPRRHPYSKLQTFTFNKKTSTKHVSLLPSDILYPVLQHKYLLN